MDDALKLYNHTIDGPLGDIRQSIYENLLKSGFVISDGCRLSIPNDKSLIRKAHEASVNHIIKNNRKFISTFEDRFLDRYIIDGKELDVDNINPVLLAVSNTRGSDLFRWIKLHWSIPISAGYGRRLRYLVYDEGNSAIIGIIGLADPVYGLKDRERLIGWDAETKKHKLKNIMDAFVLGAAPPYSLILGGKLVASLVGSPRVRSDFKSKYGGKMTRISQEIFDGKLAAVTTASALGKSSMYDRIKIPGAFEFLHAGWSKGSGEFQFYNGVYEDIFKLAHDSSLKFKNPKWGNGVRNRRTVIRKGLEMLGLSQDLLYHSIRRELFIVPLGSDSFRFLRGETKRMSYFRLTESGIADYAINRWMIPRSQRRQEFLGFKKEKYSLYVKLGCG